MSRDLPADVAAFVRAPDPERFEALALDAFAWHHERIEPYRRLCAARGVAPGSAAGWREVPMVPAAAFRTTVLAAAPAVETFRSSGTSSGDAGEERSVHHHPFPDLYRLTIDESFPRYCLAGLDRPPMLALVPDREQAPESSLSFMIDHAVARWGDPEAGAWAFGRRGVDVKIARSWAGARQRDRRPSLVLATAFALAQWLEALERQGLRFRLPPGSAAMVTGGFKGRTREIPRAELLARLADLLAIAPERVAGEYGMTELTSQLYTRALLGGDPEVYEPPPWVRVRVLDPVTLEEAPAGETGLIAIFDLANLGSAVHLLTEDLGAAEDAGVRLLGRAAGAELRGCSLAAEELAG
jgi:hypothetical protein